MYNGRALVIRIDFGLLALDLLFEFEQRFLFVQLQFVQCKHTNEKATGQSTILNVCSSRPKIRKANTLEVLYTFSNANHSAHAASDLEVNGILFHQGIVLWKSQCFLLEYQWI